jgi:hypothetical protein
VLHVSELCVCCCAIGHIYEVPCGARPNHIFSLSQGALMQGRPPLDGEGLAPPQTLPRSLPDLSCCPNKHLPPANQGTLQCSVVNASSRIGSSRGRNRPRLGVAPAADTGVGSAHQQRARLLALGNVTQVTCDGPLALKPRGHGVTAGPAVLHLRSCQCCSTLGF